MANRNKMSCKADGGAVAKKRGGALSMDDNKGKSFVKKARGGSVGGSDKSPFSSAGGGGASKHPFSSAHRG